MGELIGGGEISGMEQNDPKTHSNNKTQSFKQQNTTMDTLLLRFADSRRDIPGWLGAMVSCCISNAHLENWEWGVAKGAIEERPA